MPGTPRKQRDVQNGWAFGWATGPGKKGRLREPRAANQLRRWQHRGSFSASRTSVPLSTATMDPRTAPPLPTVGGAPDAAYADSTSTAGPSMGSLPRWPSSDECADSEWRSRQPAMSISNILNDHSDAPPVPDAFSEVHSSPPTSAAYTRLPPQPTHTRFAPAHGTLHEGTPLPSSPLPPDVRRVLRADDAWDSDEEGASPYAAELAAYRDERAAHESRIAAAYAAHVAEQQQATSQRLCVAYEKRFLATQRRRRRRTREAAALAVDNDEIDMELLDTLETKSRSHRSHSASEDYLDELAADVGLDDDGSEPPPQLIDPETGAVRGIIPIGARRAALLSEAHDRVWALIAKRDVPKVYRTVVASATNKAMYWRRLSSVVQREARRGAARNNKSTKDIQLRARKVMRELLLYWKRNEREEREVRKRAEKEALDKARKEEEMREAKRQARKLNFLITQTELYSHFVGNKLKTAEAEESEDTAGAPTPATAGDAAPTAVDMPPDTNAQATLAEIDFDDDDESNLRAHAARNATEAVRAARDKAQAFDAAVAEGRGSAAPAQPSFSADDLDFANPTSVGATEVAQPKMLSCTLKPYQLKGLTWLANLYEQGINGILADEMGLGKTVQSIALMAYLAEVHDIWGPFLVIAPASTLHNWQQEITKFVPALKALPYWGNVKDRAVLRKFWNRRQISYDRDAPFHVLVTSYQLVVSDEKYFQRLKWQYMVLDEAQAIKSSASNRWKTLLGFHCRNRLLLTGTPVQNSMQELWALLHFIMPSLFDSHDEFSEWFSKDIENHAENKGTLNEHQLRRLHMILKPFMLRRIKRNVQNELGDKIEIDVYCDLSARQKALYQGLRSHVSIAELVDKANANDESGLKSLMNLVMQFRKVCNHPELFERADVRAPLAFTSFAMSALPARDSDTLYCPDSARSLLDVRLPRLMAQDAVQSTPCESNRVGFDTHYLGNLMNIWRTPHVAASLRAPRSAFSFLPLLGLGPADVERAFHGNRTEQAVAAAFTQHHALLHPLEADDTFAAAVRRPRGVVGAPLPHATERPAPDLVPLHRVVDHVIYERLGGTDLAAAIAPAVAPPPRLYANDRSFCEREALRTDDPLMRCALYGLPPDAREDPAAVVAAHKRLPALPPAGLLSTSPPAQLWSAPMQVPQMNKLIVDSAKLARLDSLLRELKAGGHRVLIYFQMTRMIDLMEEYLIYRQYKYLRLDGASKISDRRDMVTDWQTRPELFVFLLSTRAGGLGINLTAADTVIFYDHDWNPSNDSQAMDRAHRLGQTKQVTVYRLITKGTIDERIVKLARNKKEVQDIVVGNKAYSESGMAKPQEIVSLLLDDDELADDMLRRKQADEAQVAQGKADNARASHARRKQNKAAARSSPVEQPGVNWTLDDDEDDFFGAKPPPPPAQEEEPTGKSRKRVKRDDAKRKREES